ncbi:2-amino-4-hydroxy-6-hydroxymethyldihydropteridine diphosphokinase [Pseudidiomarina andamanensis]|uniref:2-amino-4-hydroxy-6-hydroxymethyldihydropteridine diphosphokinase n=1 Tax=Pseudidiomarina andamanensis TaxID=1940690 RepID=A0AA92EST7_9GAMM|nr:2-amino-4-hydroxy-6-hydroxymethyldihydropteridine diphosphokinase [Pseudidiomarina andamanensis]MDS0218779.1 2-amino-4-hydroxy-6-hydroxymethyldihydropteridine diphosphokinase [Pseudidiomarina andamanensis]QGT95630.1 2-amino-4-hydroxy-6-hydroxymethyldihydropteridine diphosphokinase [Pseudidiomarina andamanensis]
MSWVWFGIGSNRDREHYIKAGVKALHDAFASEQHPLYISRVFESDSVGFAGSRFYNLVACVETNRSIDAIQAACKAIEKANGHDGSATRFSPRTLDIDMLMYDAVVSDTPVQLPRAEILTNAFVLWPLAELSPTLRHPVTDRTFTEHWSNYSGEQKLEPISLVFDALPYLVIDDKN